jgi:heptosyltransferase I
MPALVSPAPTGRRGERICIVLLTGLGDVVHGLPIANALKDADPTREITWVAEPMPASILERHPSVDRIVRYERRKGWRGVAGLRAAMRDARRAAGGRFDVTLNLNVYFKSLWPLLFSHGRRRLTFGPDRARDGVWLAANDRLPPRPRRHTQDMFLEFLEHLGVPHHAPAVPADWRITFGDDERRAQSAFFDALSGRPLASIVPASANAAKDWPAERWAVVADALAGDFGFEVALVGGPGAREVAIARAVAERARHPLVWAMGDGVRRVAWTLERSALVLAPDTGPLHVARALGVPVVGLYGHTNPWRVGPYRACEDLWVDKYTDGAPDPATFDPPAEDRMARITADEVIERVARAVERYVRRDATGA